jgi:hypothetical protein
VMVLGITDQLAAGAQTQAGLIPVSTKADATRLQTSAVWGGR